MLEGARKKKALLTMIFIRNSHSWFRGCLPGLALAICPLGCSYAIDHSHPRSRRYDPSAALALWAVPSIGNHATCLARMLTFRSFHHAKSCQVPRNTAFMIHMGIRVAIRTCHCSSRSLSFTFSVTYRLILSWT
ncbi:hypothetical protein JB92DRAFT_1523851 [Gautieria morchelliformis]|nr:hypothetical protein JB92DRAFT_1523851 [Gautieria morchelliformis]